MMARRQADVTLVVACSLGLVLVILAFPSAEPARLVLALPFVLFFPGYDLTAALFPRRGQIDLVERVALSLGLSVAVVPLIGLALNYSPWGIRLHPLLAFVMLFIALAVAVAAYRRRLLPEGEAFGFPVDIHLPRGAHGLGPNTALALTVLLSLAALGVAAYFVGGSRGGGETFSEFYVLASGGEASAYPESISPGGSAPVVLGLVNREGRETSYRVVAKIDGAPANEIDDLVL